MITMDALVYYGKITDKFKDANGKIVYSLEGKEFKTIYDFSSIEVGQFVSIVVDAFEDDKILMLDLLYKDIDDEWIERVKNSVRPPIKGE